MFDTERAFFLENPGYFTSLNSKACAMARTKVTLVNPELGVG